MKRYIGEALDEMRIQEIPPQGWRPTRIQVARHKVATSVLLGRRFVSRRITKGAGVVTSPQGEPPAL